MNKEEFRTGAPSRVEEPPRVSDDLEEIKNNRNFDEIEELNESRLSSLFTNENQELGETNLQVLNFTRTANHTFSNLKRDEEEEDIYVPLQ